MADQPGNWNLDDGAGHRLGAMLFERSDINTPSGLRLRLNAESGGLQLNHLRPLVLSDDQSQAWQLSNRSEELLTSPGGVIPWDRPSLMPAAWIRSLQVASVW